MRASYLYSANNAASLDGGGDVVAGDDYRERVQAIIQAAAGEPKKTSSQSAGVMVCAAAIRCQLLTF